MMLTLKVAVVGNTEAGKSALLQRYVDGTFTSVYKATTSSEYKVKPMQPVPPPPAKATTLLKILLWDTAGSDKLQAVERCKGAMAAIVVYNVGRELKDQPDADPWGTGQWLKALREQDPDVLLFLVATHLDAYLDKKPGEDRETREALLHSTMMQVLARQRMDDVPFYAVSSKDGKNVEKLMQDVVGAWMSKKKGVRKAVRTREVLVQTSGWDLGANVLLDVLIENAEEVPTGFDVVAAAGVAAAFEKKMSGIARQNVIVARIRSHSVPGSTESVGPPLPLPHAAVTKLPPSEGPAALLFQLKRKQPLTAGLHCEVYNAEFKHVTKVKLEESGSGTELTAVTVGVGKASMPYMTLDKDDPQWLPINSAERLGVKYRSPDDSNWGWERFLAEKDARAAPMSCFRVINTLNDLTYECRSKATVS